MFDITKQIELDLYVNGSDNIRGVKKAFEAWGDGFPSSVALIGEKGSGKSTLSNLLRSEVFNESTVINLEIKQSTWKMEQILSLLGKAFEIEDVNRPETVVNALNARDERIVVNLEGLQKLYLRNINGFDALEALWLIMSETKDKVFWIATCSRYAWEFLNKIEGVETHFTHVFMTDSLSDENIETAIMNRHSKSVYRLNFEADESIRKSRNYRKRLNDPKALQEYLKDVYFDRLSDITEGNTSVASILWLRSIKKVEGRTITIFPFHSANIETLEILKPETLFTLAAVVLHDTLKVAELCRVLNLTLPESRVLLTRLKSRGVLIEEDGAYYLNQLVYRQVLRLLKRRNIIH